MTIKHHQLTAIAAVTLSLTGCLGSNSTTDNNSSTGSTPAAGTPVASTCPETGTYACQTGASESLYTFQWALKAATSYFKDFINFAAGTTDNGGVSDGVTDLNVEDVHTAGIKGASVNVLVLDDGVDANHEDLAVDRTMSYNYDAAVTDKTDPTPPATAVNDSHGTNAAGIIAALQNGKGVMGIAPKVTLGGSRFVGIAGASTLEAYGGATWSKNAHVINASFGSNPASPNPYDAGTDESLTAIRAFPLLRSGKGLVFLKATGNEYVDVGGKRDCIGVSDGTDTRQIVSCENPFNDTDSLEPLVINVASGSAKGRKASYSSAGSVNWITGLGGELTAKGLYGEEGPYSNNQGPHMFSTDLSGCTVGYSRAGLAADAIEFLRPETATNKSKNSACNYSVMNGTSAATPSVAGIVALMLSANPNLTWRDVREILRATAKKIDPDYGSRSNRNVQVSLANVAGQSPLFNGTDTGSTVADGATTVRLDFGWQKNAAGYDFSNWYGFGLADAAKAVAMAKTYTSYKSATYTAPAFSNAFADVSVAYGKVTELGKFTVTGAGVVDQLQLRLNSSDNLCIGSVGFFVKSPSGTLSVLSVPYNIFYKASNNAGKDVKLAADSNYGQGSYAFYGETMAGNWTVYAVAGVPEASCSAAASSKVTVEYRVIAAQ